MLCGNYFVAGCYEVSTQVIITLAWIVIYECPAFDSDSSWISIALIQNVVVTSIIVIRLEESTLDYDVTALAVNYRVAITISISANCKCTTFDRNFCAIGCSNTDIITAGTTIEGAASDCKISICPDGFYCNGVRILSDNTSIDRLRASECFATSDRFSVLSILIVLRRRSVV